MSIVTSLISYQAVCITKSVGVATRRKKEKKWEEREDQEEPIYYMCVSLVM